MNPDHGHDFAADFERNLNEGLINVHESNMPLKLIDTYTGLILERWQITSLLKKRDDYRVRLKEAISEASPPTGPPRPSSLRPNLNLLQTFIGEYLAFAMFSHRWRGKEVVIKDVEAAKRGVYSLRGEPNTEFAASARKLQEFCCVAAKCGYRWAWSDTCCIDERVYGEKSESLNSMFLWYRSSDLTVVYLDDVDDVEEQHRLDAVGGEGWYNDVEIRDPFRLLPSDAYPSTTADPVTLHDCTRTGSLQLQTMQPDTQVEAVHLEEHLNLNFPTVPGLKARGKYRNVPVWVTRGWTLQEMLASKRLRFYSRKWTLLEEADDRETTEAENKIHISSFRYRAQLVDHRASPMWSTALENTTDVPAGDLVKFEAGSRDVRVRLGWAARRSTTKVEDMAYCLLGVFDVTLTAMYGEGHRAFFRLQEELMKRTPDASLFDWCGSSSLVNTFLAYEPECFIEPQRPHPYFKDSSDSIFWTIVDLFGGILGTTWSGVKAVAHEIVDWIRNIVRSTPTGHTIVNGGVNIGLFEHKVRSCKYLTGTTPEDPYHRYQLEVDGLKDTNVTLKSQVHDLIENPKRYHLCRIWGRDAHNVFQILLDLLGYVLGDAWKEAWSGLTDFVGLDHRPAVPDKEDEATAKLRQEIQMKRKEVLRFFQHPFPVYLVRVEDGYRVRLSTVHRVESDYTRFDFAMPVETRFVL